MIRPEIVHALKEGYKVHLINDDILIVVDDSADTGLAYSCPETKLYGPLEPESFEFCYLGETVNK